MNVQKGYYIPYSKKAINIFRAAEKKLGSKWWVDFDGLVTFEVAERKLAKLEKMLAPIV